VAVQVTGGAVPYDVVLATTRQPGGEDRARVDPGQTVRLVTGDVAWGERIDSRVLLTALDGSGATSVDELEGYEFTRPAEEDCAAIAPPTAEATVPPAAGPSGAGTDDLPPGGLLPTPDLPARPAVSVAASSDRSPGVAAGEMVTVTASGFAAGEDVVLRLADGTTLGSSVADIEGLVVTEITIPSGAEAGVTSLVVVGAVTDTSVAVELQIAASTSATDRGGDAVWPLVVAGAAVVAAAGGLALSALRRRAAGPPSGSA
jgi:hypothetical protein